MTVRLKTSVQSSKDLIRQCLLLTRHCPLTGRSRFGGSGGSIKSLGNSRGQKAMSQSIKFLERQVNDATIMQKEQTHVVDHLKLCPVQSKKKEWQGEYQPPCSQHHSSHIIFSESSTNYKFVLHSSQSI